MKPDSPVPSIVYVGIVTYNSQDDIAACLEGVEKQSYDNIRIGVFDNASTDNTIDWLQSHQARFALHLSEKNLGFGRGHNALVRHFSPTENDFYMTLNPDAVLDPNYIAKLVEAAQKYNAHWVSGKLLLVDAEGAANGYLYSAGHALCRDGYAFNIGHQLPDEDLYHDDREVFGAPGAAALYSAPLLVGGTLFDEGIFLYAEDTDVDWRARRQGFRCWYCAEAVARHRGSTPAEVLRVHAVANRYRSVVKNAYLFDLITFNAPLIMLHVMLRLILTPRFGWQLIQQLRHHIPDALQQRTTPMISRAEMNNWFRWSSQQPTATPRSLLARLQDMLKKRIRN